MKFLALNVDFNSASFDTLGSSPYMCINFGYPFQNTRVLLLSINLASEWLQIDTDLLRLIICIADELFGVLTSMTLNDLEPPKYGF